MCDVPMNEHVVTRYASCEMQLTACSLVLCFTEIGFVHVNGGRGEFRVFLLKIPKCQLGDAMFARAPLQKLPQLSVGVRQNNSVTR